MCYFFTYISTFLDQLFAICRYQFLVISVLLCCFYKLIDWTLQKSEMNSKIEVTEDIISQIKN